jgi:hypothetical protein
VGRRFAFKGGGVVAEDSKAERIEGEIVQPAELVVLRGADLTQDIIEANPERYRVLPNGAVYDLAIKRIVKAPENQAFTQAQAKEMSALRWEKARQAAAAGMAERAASIRDMSPSSVTEYDAVALMASNLVDIATTKKDRAAVEAFRAVSQAAGLVPDKQSGGGDASPALQINVSGDALARLLQLMQGIDSE